MLVTYLMGWAGGGHSKLSLGIRHKESMPTTSHLFNLALQALVN